MKRTRRDFLKLGGAAGLGLAFAKVSSADDARLPLPTVNQSIGAAVRSAPLSMLFQGSTPAEFVAWKKRFGEKMLELIGPCAPPETWTARTLETKTFPDFVREELLLSADGVPSLPLYLLRPVTREPRKFPVLLCLHGHGAGGHDSVAGRDEIPLVAEQIARHNYDYARQFARRGYLTVAPCFTPFGRRADAVFHGPNHGDVCETVFVRLMALGRTLVGENLRDARWALSYAVNRPEARADRVGCIGLSYGGRMTTMTTAFDDRIKIAVISGQANLYEQRLTRARFCGGQTIPGQMRYGDVPELGSLIAPRPAIWENGTEDPGLNEKDKATVLTRLQRAYAASGHPEALAFHSFKGGHVWNGEQALPLLARALQP